MELSALAHFTLLDFIFRGYFNFGWQLILILPQKGRKSGWTFAYADEPDLDRIIRFNNPVAPRSFVSDVGVVVTDVYYDGEYVNDSLVGQMVNLGPSSYFDGSKAFAGKEPIINFEFHVGSNEDYIFCVATRTPTGQGLDDLTEEEQSQLGIWPKEAFSALINERIQSLRSTGTLVDQERLKNMQKSITQRIMAFKVNYAADIDKNIILNPQDSGVVKMMKEKSVNRLDCNIQFYGFDGDGLGMSQDMFQQVSFNECKLRLTINKNSYMIGRCSHPELSCLK